MRLVRRMGLMRAVRSVGVMRARLGTGQLRWSNYKISSRLLKLLAWHIGDLAHGRV